MRIIAGTYGSRVIQSVDGTKTRPTTDKIKEAVFSRLGPYFDGGTILDLFAGSGSISLEALSRGMMYAYLCDTSAKAMAVIRKNIDALQVTSQCTLWRMDYKRALQQAAAAQLQFDLVYLDPPYQQQEILRILTYLDAHDMLKEQGDVVCESLKADSFPAVIGSLHKVKDATYGITRITYYRKEHANDESNVSGQL